jgi:hypothetical protein
MQMPNQTRHDLSKSGIRLWARGSDDRVGEVRVKSRDFGGVGSVGRLAVVAVVAIPIARNARTGLVGDEVQWLVGVHGERFPSLGQGQAGTDGEAMSIWWRGGEEEVFDGE